jgi:hypothetical protein
MPFEAFYGFKPSSKQLKIFGQKGFVHVLEEKQKKLDTRGLEGRVVAFCDDSKGWIFFIKETNQLIAGAVVDCPEKRPLMPNNPVDQPNVQLKETGSALAE